MSRHHPRPETAEQRAESTRQQQQRQLNPETECECTLSGEAFPFMDRNCSASAQDKNCECVVAIKNIACSRHVKSICATTTERPTLDGHGPKLKLSIVAVRIVVPLTYGKSCKMCFASFCLFAAQQMVQVKFNCCFAIQRIYASKTFPVRSFVRSSFTV